MIEPTFLSVDDVLSLHADQLGLYGGLPGVRDPGALEAAVETPRATFDGEYLHSDLFSMAAAYAFHIAESQAFVDGNKRAALNAALVFLLMNAWHVLDPDWRLYDAMIAIAVRSLDKEGLDGNSMGIELGTDWITVSSLPIYKQLLSQLSGLFIPGGFVHLQHCDAGQNHALSCAISAIFSVPVYAGTGAHNPVYRFNFGRYERCVPSGNCESDVPRPD